MILNHWTCVYHELHNIHECNVTSLSKTKQIHACERVLKNEENS